MTNEVAGSLPFFADFVNTRSRLGRSRYIVKRTLTRLNQFGRLRVRYERKAEHDPAFLYPACTIICWHVIQRWF